MDLRRRGRGGWHRMDRVTGRVVGGTEVDMYVAGMAVGGLSGWWRARACESEHDASWRADRRAARRALPDAAVDWARPACCSTTRRFQAIATRSGWCSPSSASSTSGRKVDVIDRSNRSEILGDLNPALRVPTAATSMVAGRWRSLTRSSGTSRGTPSMSPRTTSSAPRYCNGCSSSSTVTSRISPSRDSG
jgi:hypothetical protein